MRTYFITSGLQGCYYYRCFLPMGELGGSGDQTTMLLDQQGLTPEDKAYEAQQSDVIVFHRPDDPRKLELARMLKAQGKKIVFDNDDTFKDDGGFKFNKYMDKERLKKNLGTINDTVDAFIKEADLITTTTEFLAKEYRKLNPNVKVLPNCIDGLFADEPVKNTTDKVRIALTGSIGVTSDFDLAYSMIKRTENDKRLQWVLWSLPKGNDTKLVKELYHTEMEMMKDIDVEWHGFVDQELYLEKLNDLALDIMAIPRADNYFNRCKSNLKFLEASMFAIPTVAQGFPDGLSPYQVDPEDAEHMIIANNEDEFVEAINYLVDNPEKRVEMGQKAKDYVLNKYDIENNGHKWVEAYESLFKKQ